MTQYRRSRCEFQPLLNALDSSFGYRCYSENDVKQTEFDDLATRKRTWEKAEAFCQHSQKIKAAYRYSRLQVAKNGVLADCREKLKNLGKWLSRLNDLMDSEAKLQSQLLNPFADSQQIYRTRYLQAFDQVTGKCESVKAEIDNLCHVDESKALAELAKIDALSSFNLAELKNDVASCKLGLFESAMDRNGVERALKDRPQPEGCTLHIDEAAGLIAAAEEALNHAKGFVRSALLNIANLLRQPSLIGLLKQGRHELFILEVLNAVDADSLGDVLSKGISSNPQHAVLLGKYLKKILVKIIRLQDFHPSKATIEKGDIEKVVSEFRQFLSSAANTSDNTQFTILEIK